MAAGGKAKKYTEEGYQQLLENVARAKRQAALASSVEPPLASELPLALPKGRKKAAPSPSAEPAGEEPAHGAIAAMLGVPQQAIVAEKKKRQGVKQTPIMTAVRDCLITVEAGPKHIVIAFDGARLFTLNEMFAILQVRKYIVFGYKKLWRELVYKALAQMGKKKPHFDGPCKVTLFRQGARMIDRDSLFVMFKYIIDALKDEPKLNYRGIFPDDNPDIVYSDEKLQAIGEPVIALRVELIDPAPVPKTHAASDLFENPALWNKRQRPQPAISSPASPEPAALANSIALGAAETPSAPATRKARSSKKPPGAEPNQAAIAEKKTRKPVPALQAPKTGPEKGANKSSKKKPNDQ